MRFESRPAQTNQLIHSCLLCDQNAKLSGNAGHHNLKQRIHLHANIKEENHKLKLVRITLHFMLALFHNAEK